MDPIVLLVILALLLFIFGLFTAAKFLIYIAVVILIIWLLLTFIGRRP